MGDTDKFEQGPGPDSSFEYVLDESGLHDTSDTFERPEPKPSPTKTSSTARPTSSSPMKWVVLAAVVAVALGGGAYALFSSDGSNAAASDEPELAGGFKPYMGGGKDPEQARPAAPTRVEPEPEIAEVEEEVIEESEPMPDEPGWDLEEPEEVPVDVEVVEETTDDAEDEGEEIADADVEVPEDERVRALRVPRSALKRTIATPLRPKMPTPSIGAPSAVSQERFKNIPIRTINPRTGELETRRPGVEEEAEEE